MAANAKAVIGRVDAMFADRGTLASHWDEVARFCYPLAGSVTGTNTLGAKRYLDIFRNHAEFAHDLLVAGLMALITNPATRWCKAEPENERLAKDDAVARWCDDATRRAFAVMNRPEMRTYTSLTECYNDIGGFGISAKYTAERPGKVPLVQARPMKEIAVAEGADGAVDTVARDFCLTARQAVQEYGDKAGPKTRALAEREPGAKVKFAHLCEPRTEKMASTRLTGAGAMPFASVHVNKDEQVVVRESGHHEFPWQIGRWKKAPGEAYGRGPGMQALADVKLLQRTAKANIRGAEKTINPPWMVEHDGITSPVRGGDSQITYVRQGSLHGSGAPIRALHSGARPDIGIDILQDIERIVDQAYYRPLMETLRDPRATATQVIKIQEEQTRTIGPILVRLLAEDIVPFIERIFAILLRAGVFLPLPEQLQGQRLKIVMVSQLANTQRLGELSAIAQLLDFILPLANADPTVLDNYDTDWIARHAPGTLGAPAMVLRPERQRDAMRDARLQKKQQQEAVQEATMLAGAAGAAAPLMRPTNRGEGQKNAA